MDVNEVTEKERLEKLLVCEQQSQITEILVEQAKISAQLTHLAAALEGVVEKQNEVVARSTADRRWTIRFALLACLLVFANDSAGIMKFIATLVG